MKKQIFKKLMAASLATAMTIGLAACGSEPANTPASSEETPATSEETPATSEETPASEEEEVSQYTTLTDENGNVYDLGGMEIIIRDWWTGEPTEPSNDYEEAREEYREWIQSTYNFTIKQTAISDWGSTPEDFVNYATTGGDENYVFILRDDPAITGAMANGLMYDLATLDCLDFSEAKFQKNLLHKLYSKGDSIYAMYAGVSEPRGGVYFNKRILTEAGIDPESIYDLQASGDWTWDKWTELMDQVQQDTDNDGVIDIYGTTQNNGNLTNSAVWSNNGEYVGQENGQYVYKLENAETVEALEFAVKIFDNYTLPYPEGANWDYYKEAFLNGQAAFMPEDGYAGTPGNFLQDMVDDFGWVAFPKGPKATDYTNCWSNNPAAIPACYDADKAWKIAFAWNLYTNEAPGWEDYEGWKPNYYAGFRDTRAVDETAKMLTEKGMITYHGLIPNLNLGPDLTWGIAPGTVVSEKIDAIRDTWKSYIDAANAQ